MNLKTDETVTRLEPTSASGSGTASPPGCVEGSRSRLPVAPLVTIEADAPPVGLGLREIWSYRELLYFLMWRDIKVRYKQTVLGAAWAIIQPLFTMLVFSLFFGSMAHVQSDNIPYPIFAYAGLLPWTFFSNAVTNSGNSLVGSTNLITKVYFPRAIIPAAAVGAGLVDLAIASLILVFLMFYYGVALSWSALMLAPLVVLLTTLALAVGMWMSALNVKYRDIRFALPFVIQLWMFLSPVIYPASIVTGKLRWALVLNPLTGLVEGFRAALFDRHFEWVALLVSATVTIAFLFYSAYTFRRLEDSFADIV